MQESIGQFDEEESAFVMPKCVSVFLQTVLAYILVGSIVAIVVDLIRTFWRTDDGMHNAVCFGGAGMFVFWMCCLIPFSYLFLVVLAHIERNRVDITSFWSISIFSFYVLGMSFPAVIIRNLIPFSCGGSSILPLLEEVLLYYFVLFILVSMGMVLINIVIRTNWWNRIAIRKRKC